MVDKHNSLFFIASNRTLLITFTWLDKSVVAVDQSQEEDQIVNERSSLTPKA